MRDLPLISCLCITQNRLAHLKNAIAYFNNQSYPYKELIIVTEDSENQLKDLIHRDNTRRITLINVESSQLTLGEKRNISVENCNGQYFCQWDDDDWYHNRRLELQMNSLLTSGKQAGVLTRWILYDSIEQQAYLSSERLWEGSVLCNKDIFSDVFKYPGLTQGEDHSFLKKLIDRNLVHSLSAPHLYMYIYHGGNTCNNDHFQQLFKAGYKLSMDSNFLIGKILEGKYSHDAASELMLQSVEVG